MKDEKDLVKNIDKSVGYVKVADFARKFTMAFVKVSCILVFLIVPSKIRNDVEEYNKGKNEILNEVTSTQEFFDFADYEIELLNDKLDKGEISQEKYEEIWYNIKSGNKYLITKAPQDAQNSYKELVKNLKNNIGEDLVSGALTISMCGVAMSAVLKNKKNEEEAE